MMDWLLLALDTVERLGARYGDARVVHIRTQTVRVRNGVVTALEESETLGLGVRALVGNGWGFSATPVLEAAAVQRAAAQAVSIALASNSAAAQRVDLGPSVTSRGVYHTPVEEDPFAVPVTRKVDLLLAADAAMAAEPRVRVRQGVLTARREHKWFANTEGARTEQVLVETGGGLSATAVHEGEVQRRSYPATLGRAQNTGGWEIVREWDLLAHAPLIAHEAAALTTADPCPAGRMTVILGGDQLALQIHESCGHPIELDRVLGSEAMYAGTSFLTPDKLGTFRYGSEVVNIVADATQPRGLGTFGWDDAGVPAQRTPIVQNGVFVGYLTSRETAARLGQTSNGSMRASGWDRIPLVRMTNVSLEPGPWPLEDLLADTDHGVYLETNRSWSIDDKRYNFQFGTEIGWEIRRGRKVRLLRNCLYTGITPEFWRSCDAVADAQAWTMWGTTRCGKGQPSQIMRTGHGAAPARFRNVQVGALR